MSPKNERNVKSIDFLTKRQRISNFEVAKKLALQLDKGRFKRAKADGIGTTCSTYSAACLPDGTHIVIGDSMEDIPKPTQFINGRPAMKVSLHTQLNLS